MTARRLSNHTLRCLERSLSSSGSRGSSASAQSFATGPHHLAITKHRLASRPTGGKALSHFRVIERPGAMIGMFNLEKVEPFPFLVEATRLTFMFCVTKAEMAECLASFTQVWPGKPSAVPPLQSGCYAAFAKVRPLI